MPSTTDHDEPSLRTGKPNCRPSGTPYWPELHTATEWKSSPGVAKCTLFTESSAACAADADDEHAHVARRVVVDGLTLGLEDAAVDREQVAALHACLARDRADEQRPRRAVERSLEVSGRLDADEERVGAVLQLHHHALEHGQ